MRNVVGKVIMYLELIGSEKEEKVKDRVAVPMDYLIVFPDVLNPRVPRSNWR